MSFVSIALFGVPVQEEGFVIVAWVGALVLHVLLEVLHKN